jgi:amidohydrolase
MNIAQQIKELSARIYPELQVIREHLHQYPELSFQEHATSAFIQKKLRMWKIPFKTGYVDTGIVAELRGQKEGNDRVLVRADMDALPIQEKNNVDYSSKIKGVMHACGHDVHTTSVLGAIAILNQLKHSWGGSFRFIFQPAEEQVPGGAKGMIEQGVLQNPAVKAAIALHVEPYLPIGSFGFCEGDYMASADEVHLTVRSEGGHAANPHLVKDTVLIASQLLVALQQISSRYAPPKIPTVLSFGKIIGNGATNVIPPEVSLAGTFRTFDEKWRAEGHRLIRQIANGIAHAYGVEIETDIRIGYPVLTNHTKLTRTLADAATKHFGSDKIHWVDSRLSAEDFAYFSQSVPSCFFRLGVRNEKKGITFPVHHPRFDADEQAVKFGAESLALFALQVMELDLK